MLGVTENRLNSKKYEAYKLNEETKTKKSFHFFWRFGILRLPTAKFDKEEWQTPAGRLFYRLSATHLVLFANLKEPETPITREEYEKEI